MYQPDTPYGAYPKRSPLETKPAKLPAVLAVAYLVSLGYYLYVRVNFSMDMVNYPK
jgi:hypothetical protein